MLIAHLARRAGFGATRDELDRYVSMGYEAMVEELLHPGDPQIIPDDVIRRRFPEYHTQMNVFDANALWAYRMVTTKCPFLEKVALLWHGVFATGNAKLLNPASLLNQMDMFREYGMGRFDDLLLQLSRDPAMIIGLDNQANHNGAINENYGREILELFSMGVGNYTEDDIKECARAFTGWTIGNAEYMTLKSLKDSIWPYCRIFWHFQYHEDDHDDGEKLFLGERGRFNGEDVIDIICRQPATARFIARHLYTFFVADEVPVPQWANTPPRDPKAIATLVQAYMESGHDILSVLRVLFNSDFFKEARFNRFKSPIDLIIGTLRLTGEHRGLDASEPGIVQTMRESAFMGQAIMNPPSVEGWHTGSEWIDSGSLIERVNFAADHMADLGNPGVRDIMGRIVQECGESPSPAELVDACLDTVGPLVVSDDTRTSLIETASRDRELPQDEKQDQLMLDLLKMIVSSREYQLV
jgi:uncharacterized protein (DUF1800 family)